VPEPSPAPPPIVEAQLPQGEPALDIGLAWDLDTTRVSFSGTLPFDVTGAGASGPHVAGGPVELRVSGTQVIVRPRDKKRAVPLLMLAAGDTLWIGGAELEAGDTPRIKWNGGTYRGRFKVFLNARRKLTLATRLALEPYLKGVVPGEIGALSDSLLEAGRAQAIAARSYTLFYKGRRGAEGFDLYATVEDQFYSPTDAEKPLATRCVESTNGLVGLWRGVPIRANYSSTCGGISAEAWEAWPTPAYDYLSSHPDGPPGSDHCAASPHHRWREEWQAKDFAANLARFGPQFGVPLPAGGVGEVVDVRVLQRSRSGRVWRLEVETSTGRIQVHAHSMRQVLRRSTNTNAILRSNLFKIAVRRDASTRRALSVVASGAGSGHGVGLCQTGALGMARRGARGEAILAHYYPGAALSRLY
jgi:stage II sporulation protein D